MDHDRYLDPIVELAEDAGRRILAIYDTDFTTEHKDGGSPLTAADLASHRAIVEGLAGLAPDVPVLSEESDEHTPHRVRRDWPRFWLVDPLDGTKEFIKRNGEFTVNIALVEGGRPVLGVVHAPVLAVTYAAATGAGASKRSRGGPAEPVKVQPHRDGELRVVVSRSHAGPETEALLAALERDHPLAPVPTGSSLKLCLVADGAAHLYPRLGPTMEWDTAAAHCVVEQAGGAVTDLAGAALRYNKEDLHNPFFLVTAGDPAPWLRYLAR